MKVRSLIFSMLCLLAMGTSVVACSDDDDDFLDDTGSKVTLPQTRMYILNEGGWGYNNAGIAFYAPNWDADFISDIFKKQNELGLGDLGQSMIVHNDEIYVAVKGSNYLVQLNAACVEQNRVEFSSDNDLSAGVRYIAAEGNYIYASFWGGAVAKINVHTLQIEDKLTGLGQNLESVAIHDGMLYVANACSGDYATYFTDVFVIDLSTFKLKDTLTVASNPNRVMLKENKKIFLISDDYASPAGYVLQMIDPAKNNRVTQIGNASLAAAHNGVLYCVNSVTDWSQNPAVTRNVFFTYDIMTGETNTVSFLENAPTELLTSSLYMLEVNDRNGEIYISTTDFVTNGTIYRFCADGTFIGKFDAGGINPSHAVFFN